jgi:hypothetical protein
VKLRRNEWPIIVAGFNGKHRRIQAIMTVTDSEWQHTFEVARWDGTLNEYGFSMLPSVIERTVKLRSGQRLPKVEIVDIWSVDLVDEPLFGGRFMGPEPSPDRLLEAWAWQEKFIGD